MTEIHVFPYAPESIEDGVEKGTGSKKQSCPRCLLHVLQRIQLKLVHLRVYASNLENSVVPGN